MPAASRAGRRLSIGRLSRYALSTDLSAIRTLFRMLGAGAMSPCPRRRPAHDPLTSLLGPLHVWTFARSPRPNPLKKKPSSSPGHQHRGDSCNGVILSDQTESQIARRLADGAAASARIPNKVRHIGAVFVMLQLIGICFTLGARAGNCALA
jgi:hypothetical protein